MNAYLQGLLLGGGQAGQAIAGARKEQEDKALREKQIGLQERQVALAESQAYEDPTTYAPLFKVLGLDDPTANMVGPQKMRAGTMAAMLPIAAAQQKERTALKRETDDRQGIADVLREAAGTPPTPAQIAPDVPVADGMDSLMNILMPGRAPMPMNDVRPKLARYGKEGRETFKEMYPQDKYASGAQGIFHTGTGEVSTPADPKEPDSGQRNEARAAAILRQRGIKEGTQQWNEGMYVLTNPTPTVPDMGVFSRLDVLGKIPGPGGTPPPTAPAPRIPAPQKGPEAGERQDIREFNSLITTSSSLLKDWDANANIKPGPGARLAERELPLGLRLSDLIGPQQTPAQREFMARATRVVGTYRRIQSGLAVTNSELLSNMPLIPKDVGAITREQLGELDQWARDNRAEIDRALIAANRLPGPAPLTPAAPGEAPLVRVTEPKTQTFKELPPAAQFKGREIENPVTKQVLRSDGTKWVPVGR